MIQALAMGFQAQLLLGLCRPRPGMSGLGRRAGQVISTCLLAEVSGTKELGGAKADGSQE